MQCAAFGSGVIFLFQPKVLVIIHFWGLSLFPAPSRQFIELPDAFLFPGCYFFQLAPKTDVKKAILLTNL